ALAGVDDAVLLIGALDEALEVGLDRLRVALRRRGRAEVGVPAVVEPVVSRVERPIGTADNTRATSPLDAFQQPHDSPHPLISAARVPPRPAGQPTFTAAAAHATTSQSTPNTFATHQPIAKNSPAIRVSKARPGRIVCACVEILVITTSSMNATSSPLREDGP